MELQKGKCSLCRKTKVIVSSHLLKACKIISSFSTKILNVGEFKKIKSSMKFCPICYHKLIILKRINDNIGLCGTLKDEYFARNCFLCKCETNIFQVKNWKYFDEIFGNLEFEKNEEYIVCSECLFHLEIQNEIKTKLFLQYPQLKVKPIEKGYKRQAELKLPSEVIVHSTRLIQNRTANSLKKGLLEPTCMASNENEEKAFKKYFLTLDSLKKLKPLKHNKTFKDNCVVKSDIKFLNQIPYVLLNVSDFLRNDNNGLRNNPDKRLWKKRKFTTTETNKTETIEMKQDSNICLHYTNISLNSTNELKKYDIKKDLVIKLPKIVPLERGTRGYQNSDNLLKKLEFDEYKNNIKNISYTEESKETITYQSEFKRYSHDSYDDPDTSEKYPQRKQNEMMDHEQDSIEINEICNLNKGIYQKCVENQEKASSMDIQIAKKKELNYDILQEMKIKSEGRLKCKSDVHMNIEKQNQQDVSSTQIMVTNHGKLNKRKLNYLKKNSLKNFVIENVNTNICSKTTPTKIRTATTETDLESTVTDLEQEEYENSSSYENGLISINCESDVTKSSQAQVLENKSSNEKTKSQFNDEQPSNANNTTATGSGNSGCYFLNNSLNVKTDLENKGYERKVECEPLLERDVADAGLNLESSQNIEQGESSKSEISLTSKLSDDAFTNSLESAVDQQQKAEVRSYTSNLIEMNESKTEPEREQNLTCIVDSENENELKRVDLTCENKNKGTDDDITGENNDYEINREIYSADSNSFAGSEKNDEIGISDVDKNNINLILSDILLQQKESEETTSLYKKDSDEDANNCNKRKTCNNDLNTCKKRKKVTFCEDVF